MKKKILNELQRRMQECKKDIEKRVIKDWEYKENDLKLPKRVADWRKVVRREKWLLIYWKKFLTSVKEEKYQ